MRPCTRCLNARATHGGAGFERVWRTIATDGRADIFVLLAVVLLAVGALAGCGQRGPLTLPNRDVEAAPVVEATPVSAAETQVETEEQESDDEED